MYVVLIGLCILVFAYIMPKSASAENDDRPSPQMVKDMEETMEGFLTELEEDNHKLMETISAMKQEHGQSIRKLTDRLEGMERQMQDERQDWRKLALSRVEQQEQAATHLATRKVQQETVALSPPVEDSVQPKPQSDPPSIKSRYEAIFRMHEEGKSVEYIAKKAGLNKGEVSLIIQLALQEEQKGAEK